MNVLSYFDDMIDHCLAYAEAARAGGRPVVGVLCEYTPRELIMAAGAVPVCLCGGSAEMIAPAEEVLPANLCPLIKSTFGYHLTGANPFLEMADLIVGETTCDGKKKMYELMSRRRAMHIMELPQNPGGTGALGRWISELRRLKAFLEARYGVRITPGRLRKAIVEMNAYRGLRRRLAEEMAGDRPAFTGRQLLDAKSLIWGMPGDMAEYARVIDLLEGRAARSEIQSTDSADFTERPKAQDRRLKETLPPARSQPSAFSLQPSACCGDNDPSKQTLLGGGANRLHSPVRVLLTGVPVLHGAEKVADCIESCGGLIVCMENCTGLKPLLDDVDEHSPPLEALARKYLSVPCSVMSPNDGRMDSLRRLVRQYRPACVIDLTWQACLTYDVESARVKQLAQEELGLPYLKISTDYSPLDAPRIALRVEALFETIVR